MSLTGTEALIAWGIIAVVVGAVALWIVKRVAGVLMWLLLAGVISVPSLTALASDALAPLRNMIGL